jgi:hypothetical protein
MELATKNYAEAIATKQKIEEQLEEAIEKCREARECVYALCEHDFVMQRMYDYKSYTCSKCGFER